jgi:Amt family ammonium transporter
MLAEQLRNSMREGDVLARVGGDEFAVLLYDCSPESALRVAENVLEAVHELRVPWDREILTVGLSVGIAPCVPGEAAARDVLRRADAACYDAKKLGGDRVEMAQVVA